MPELAESLVKKLEELKNVMEEVMEINKLMNSKLELVSQKLDKLSILEEINKKVDRTNYLLATSGTRPEVKQAIKQATFERVQEVAKEIQKVLESLGRPIKLKALQGTLEVDVRTFKRALGLLKKQGVVVLENGEVRLKKSEKQEKEQTKQRKYKGTPEEELDKGFVK